MKLEDRLNKLLKDIDFNDISTLGESIAEIDESDILEWNRIHKIKKPNIYEYYKYNCVRHRVRDLCKRFFKMRPRFDGRELEILFDLKSMVAVKELLNNLVKEGYLECLGDCQYKVLTTDDYAFVEMCISSVWKNGVDNFECQNEQLDKVLKTQLKDKYIRDERFLKDIIKVFGEYSEDLLKMSITERSYFFKSHMHNVSRGYLLKLMLLKYIYRDMIEGMEYNVDSDWILRLKDKYFNWKGLEEKQYH